MSTPERSVRDVQDECALVAADLESLVQRLVRLRESLRLPPDTLELYENRDIPWPLELELDAAIGTAIDDELESAATRLRKAARLNAERLRQKVLAQRESPQAKSKADQKQTKGTA